jgi:hypothetical protein
MPSPNCHSIPKKLVDLFLTGPLTAWQSQPLEAGYSGGFLSGFGTPPLTQRSIMTRARVDPVAALPRRWR